MLLLQILTSGLGLQKRGPDIGLIVGAVGLIACGLFAYFSERPAERALRIELADLNVRQADQKNQHEDLVNAFVQVTARLSALEQQAVARQPVVSLADVLETGSLAEPSRAGKPSPKTKRARGSDQ